MTFEQRRAAELLGRNFSQPEVGRLVGRSERTIRTWLRDVEGFREAVQAARAETSDPTALDTLRHALAATRKDGSPDWPTRVQAARALLQAPPELEQPDAQPTIVYAPELQPADG